MDEPYRSTIPKTLTEGDVKELFRRASETLRGMKIKYGWQRGRRPEMPGLSYDARKWVFDHSG